MAWHCANPACSLPLHRLKDGRLFRFEIRSSEGIDSPDVHHSHKVTREISHFWLCGECSSKLTLVFDQAKGVTVVSLAAFEGEDTDTSTSQV